MIAAVVLAAGASSRMGVPKWSLAAGDRGETFLDAILATLREAGVTTVGVVVRPDFPRSGAPFVINPDPDRGMLSSLQCGLRALPPAWEAALAWPVDHPLVTAATVRKLIAAFETTRAPIVVPVHAGTRGHPALFAASVHGEIDAAHPGAGARAVVHAHQDRVELRVDDAGVTTGIDDADAYRRAFGVEPEAPGAAR